MTEDEILDKIDEWHVGDYTNTLHEFLGWSWEEYRNYVEMGVIPK